MFKQDFKQFVTSKTNWIMMLGIVSSTYAFLTGGMDQGVYMQTIIGALGAMGIRDAI